MPGSSCVPGEERTCDCPEGSAATAVCSDQGQLGPCNCEAVIDQYQACRDMNEVLCSGIVACGFDSSVASCLSVMPDCDPTVLVPQALLEDCQDGLRAQSCSEIEAIIFPIACEDLLRGG